jgi:hypothetical protein
MIMRRALIRLLVLPLVFACTEYEIGNKGKTWGEPNPPELESPIQLDRIVQAPTPSVDVLWVIDNSTSMYGEQAALSANFAAFINYFVDSGLDWHVGVVSTDMGNSNHQGKLRTANGVRFLDEDTSELLTTFKSMVTISSTMTATKESGRAAAYTALETRRNGYNAGFYRDAASLSVIVISDEDDYSGSNPVTRNEFISWMLNLKTSPDKVNFSSIVGPPGGCPTAVEEGTDYISVTNSVGGILWSICNTDWSTVLDQLGMQASGLKREFFLSQLPVIGTIDVWVVFDGITYTFDEGSCDDCYTYDPARNSITFNTYVPDPLAEVHIEYEVLAAQQLDDDGAADTADTGAQ